MTTPTDTETRTPETDARRFLAFVGLNEAYGIDWPETAEEHGGETPGNLRQWALVERNVKGSTPPYWLTTWNTPEDARRYARDQEYPEDYTEEELRDLDAEGEPRYWWRGASATYDDAGAMRVEWAECGECGARWNDAIVTGRTPAPSARCPYEDEHGTDVEDHDDTRERADTAERELAELRAGRAVLVDIEPEGDGQFSLDYLYPDGTRTVEVFTRPGYGE